MIKLQQTPMRGVEDNLKIALSDTAINKLVGDLNKRSTYRVTIVAYGWGGPTFALVPGEQESDDYIEEYKGIKILVQEMLIEKFVGFRIDYTHFFLARGFYIQALNYGSKC